MGPKIICLARISYFLFLFLSVFHTYNMITARYGRIGLLILLPFCVLLMVYYGYYNNQNRYPSYKYDYKNQQDQNQTARENAAFVVLARNSDLNGLRESMQMMEDRFNKKFNYPWVFLNNEPFDDKFKEWTTGLASGKTYYGELTQEMWGYPDWIDQQKAKESRDAMQAAEVIYGGLESYRHMCRYVLSCMVCCGSIADRFVLI